jgi:CRP-like cAMP-binding protein
MRSAGKIAILSTLPGLAGCPPVVIDDLADAAVWVEVAAGEQLFEVGDAGRRLIVLAEGRVRLSVPSPEGKEITIATAVDGDLFGEIAVLDGGVRTARATALVPSRLLSIDRVDLMRLMQKHWILAERMLHLVCAHLRRATTQIEELTFAAAPSRVARALVRALGASATTPRPGATILLTQRELAERTGLSRESANRVLRDFERQGWVELQKGRIVITQVDMLSRLAMITLV